MTTYPSTLLTLLPCAVPPRDAWYDVRAGLDFLFSRIRGFTPRANQGWSASELYRIARYILLLGKLVPRLILGSTKLDGRSENGKF